MTKFTVQEENYIGDYCRRYTGFQKVRYDPLVSIGYEG